MITQNCKCIKFIDGVWSKSPETELIPLVISKDSLNTYGLEILGLKLEETSKNSYLSNNMCIDNKVGNVLLYCETCICSPLNGRVIFSKLLGELFKLNHVGKCTLRVKRYTAVEMALPATLLPLGSDAAMLLVHNLSDGALKERGSVEAAVLLARPKPVGEVRSVTSSTSTSTSTSSSASAAKRQKLPQSRVATLDARHSRRGAIFMKEVTSRNSIILEEGKSMSMSFQPLLHQDSGCGLPGGEVAPAVLPSKAKKTDTFKMLLKETKTRSIDGFLVSPDMPSSDGASSASYTPSIDRRHRGGFASGGSIGSGTTSQTPLSASTITTSAAAAVGESGAAPSSSSPGNWDDTCSPGETPGNSKCVSFGATRQRSRLASSPPAAPVEGDVATGIAMGRIEVIQENSLYIDHDYSYDECGSRSFYQEFRESDRPSSSGQSSSLPLGATGIFQSVMLGANAASSSSALNPTESNGLSGYGPASFSSSSSSLAFGSEAARDLQEILGRPLKEFLKAKKVGKSAFTAVAVLTELRSSLLASLQSPQLFPPIETGFSLSATLLRHIHSSMEKEGVAGQNLDLRCSQQQVQVLDCFTAVSAMLSDALSMKIKSNQEDPSSKLSSTQLISDRSAIVAAAVVQIVLQLESLKALQDIENKTTAAKSSESASSVQTKAVKASSAIFKKAMGSSKRLIQTALLKLQQLFGSSQTHEEGDICNRFDPSRIISFFSGTVESGDITLRNRVDSELPAAKRSNPDNTTYRGEFPENSSSVSKLNRCMDTIADAYATVEKKINYEVLSSITKYNPTAYLTEVYNEIFDDSREDIEFAALPSTNPQVRISNVFSFYGQLPGDIPLGQDIQNTISSEKALSTRLLEADRKAPTDSSRQSTSIVLAKASRANLDLATTLPSYPLITSDHTASGNSLLRKPSVLIGHRAALEGRLQRTTSVHLASVPSQAKKPDSKAMSNDKMKSNRSLKRSFSEASGCFNSLNPSKNAAKLSEDYKFIPRPQNSRASRSSSSEKEIAKLKSAGPGINKQRPIIARKAVEETPLGKLNKRMFNLD